MEEVIRKSLRRIGVGIVVAFIVLWALADFATNGFSANPLQPSRLNPDGNANQCLLDLDYIGALSPLFEEYEESLGSLKSALRNKKVNLEFMVNYGKANVNLAKEFAAVEPGTEWARGVQEILEEFYAFSSRELRHLENNRLSDAEVASTGAISNIASARDLIQERLVACSRLAD